MRSGEADRRGGRVDTTIRRRAYLTGLLVGTPTVPVIWYVRGPDDVFMQVTYPLLTIFLVVVTLGLWQRWLPVRTAERVMLVSVGAFYVVRLAVAVHTAEDLAGVTGELTESTFWNINLLFIFAYLAFETRRAVQVCLSVYAMVVLVLAARLVPDVLAGVHVAEAVTYLRVVTFLGAGIALLYGLAHVKDQLARVRATADEMTELAHTDLLTQLANRRRLEDVLDARLLDAKRYQRTLSVLLLDIDAFKQINDRYGHLTGDRVLQETATILEPELRANDVLGRWGGEEFLVVAPETPSSPAEQIAERCRTVISDHRFTGIDHAVTVSIGVATYQPGDHARDLVKRADDALYAAKRGGRNRVCMT